MSAKRRPVATKKKKPHQLEQVEQQVEQGASDAETPRPRGAIDEPGEKPAPLDLRRGAPAKSVTQGVQ